MTIETMTTFFGWCTVVGFAIYIFSAVAVMLFKNLVISLNTRLFDMTEDAVMRETFAFLGRFKLLLIVFALTPWLALTLMA